MNPTKAENLTIQDVGDEVLVHEVDSGKVHVLNEVAGYILKRCDGTHSADAIARALASETGADIGIVGPDVDKILSEFVSLGLLLPQVS
jgi:methyltransferase-like protein